MKKGSVSIKTILFSGTHGVGKGFFLGRVKENLRHYNVYSASALIEQYKASTDAGYKKVSNVNSNQDALIRAVKKVKNDSEKDFILDGHLCVFNGEGKVERIPEYFFDEAQITGIVLLQDDPKVICDRINQRDTYKMGIQDIELMQVEEQEYAKELEIKLQIRYAIITHECTGKQFEKILREIGGKYCE